MQRKIYNQPNPSTLQNSKAAQEELEQFRTNEIYIAVVGPLGSGTTTIAKIIEDKIAQYNYEPNFIKVSALIMQHAKKKNVFQSTKFSKSICDDMLYKQDLGDEIRLGKKYNRKSDYAAVARLILKSIWKARAKSLGKSNPNTPITPDGKKRAFIINSLRHPSEIHILRKIYGNGFYLVGVVCDPEVRTQRITNKCFPNKRDQNSDSIKKVEYLLKRDQKATIDHGQQVSKTFHESDFFIDNSDNSDEILTTEMIRHIDRFLSIITKKEIERPTVSETAMYHAHSSQLRSACLSRQVGAALVDKFGNIVSTGTNDVPKAGGGLYGETFSPKVAEESDFDHRCVYRPQRFCSNTKEQFAIVKELVNLLKEYDIKVSNKLFNEIKNSKIGELIEFSRAVHAEMDAILSAAISGASPIGCKMYVTTFPCHYCARHIVAAGIDEVQYIEPYPKSKALKLHEDSITVNSNEWVSPSSVSEFEPVLEIFKFRETNFQISIDDDTKKINDDNTKTSKEDNKNNCTESEDSQNKKEVYLNYNSSKLLPKVLFRPFVGVSPKLYRKVFLKDREYKNKKGNYDEIEPDWGEESDLFKESYAKMEFDLKLD